MKLSEIDKKRLLVLVLEAMGFSAEQVNKVSDGFSNDATLWPNSTESHSDTNRSQLQHMSMAARRDAVRVEGEIEMIKTLEATLEMPLEVIGLGALVEVEMSNGSILNVLIIPGGTTVTVDYEGVGITAVGIEAALAESLLGKKDGESAEVNGKTVKVLSFS